MRGTWRAWGKEKTPCLTSFHPSALLRRPEGKAQAWKDMLILKEKLFEIRKTPKG
jgi:uracil-DNA glycosylase